MFLARLAKDLGSDPEALQYRAQRQPAVSAEIDKSVQLVGVYGAGADAG